MPLFLGLEVTVSDARRLALLAAGMLPLALAPAGTTHAAGPWLYEGGTPDMGSATAGRQALADDASIARGNPAGMTFLKRSEVMAAYQPFRLSLDFDSDSATNVGGNDGDDAGDIFHAGGLYAVHKVNNDLAVGLFTGSLLSSRLNYDEDWVGRYQIQRRSLVTVQMLPSVAYRPLRWLSVGGGIGVEYARLSQKTAINNVLDDLPDGRIRFKDDSAEPFAHVGIFLEPRRGTRIGAIYTSKAEHTFKDAPRLSDVGPTLEAALALAGLSEGDTKLEVTRPQQVQASIYQEVTDRLAVMGSLGWQDFSDFGRVQVAIRTEQPDSFTSNRNFKDAYHFAVGLRYLASDRWTLSTGAALDTSPVRNRDRTPDAPVDRQIRLGAGAQYKVDEDTTIGLAYTYLDLGDNRLDSEQGDLAGRVKGDYDASVHFIGLQFRRSFDWEE